MHTIEVESMVAAQAKIIAAQQQTIVILHKSKTELERAVVNHMQALTDGRATLDEGGTLAGQCLGLQRQIIESQKAAAESREHAVVALGDIASAQHQIIDLLTAQLTELRQEIAALTARISGSLQKAHS